MKDADQQNGIHESHMARLESHGISTTVHDSLPAGYYHSQDIYELERRAIFSRRWFLVSHEARYRKVGDYVQYEMAGFNFLVVRSKGGDLIAFHNMCRSVSIIAAITIVLTIAHAGIDTEGRRWYINLMATQRSFPANITAGHMIWTAI